MSNPKKLYDIDSSCQNNKSEQKTAHTLLTYVLALPYPKLFEFIKIGVFKTTHFIVGRDLYLSDFFLWFAKVDYLDFHTPTGAICAWIVNI